MKKKTLLMIPLFIFIVVTLGISLYSQQEKLNQENEEKRQKAQETAKLAHALMALGESAKGETFFFDAIGCEVEVEADIQRQAVNSYVYALEDMPPFYLDMITKVILVDEGTKFDADTGVLRTSGNQTAIRMELSRAYAHRSHILDEPEYQNFYQTYKNQMGYEDDLSPEDFFAYSVENYYIDRQPYFEMCDALPYYDYLFSIFGQQDQ